LRLRRRFCNDKKNIFFFSHFLFSTRRFRLGNLENGKLTSARHRLRIFGSPVKVLITTALGGARVRRHAVVGTRLALVITVAVLVFARRTYYNHKKKEKN
jgi:hypothetical protein